MAVGAERSAPVAATRLAQLGHLGGEASLSGLRRLVDGCADDGSEVGGAHGCGAFWKNRVKPRFTSSSQSRLILSIASRDG